MSDGGRPKARGGILAADHSKRGQRWVTLLDRNTAQVTLLEPWEHSVLLLLDGTRTVHDVVDLLAPSVDGQSIDEEIVARCFRYFRRQSLTVDAEPRIRPGPRTMADLQAAYAEWHKEPMSTEQHAEWLAPPLPGTGMNIAPGLGPTTAMDKSNRGVGTTLLLAEADSLIASGATGDGATDAVVPVFVSRQRPKVLVPAAPPQVLAELDASDGESGDLDVLSAVDSAVREASAVVGRRDRSTHDTLPGGYTPPPESGLRPTIVGAEPADGEPAPRDGEALRSDDDTAALVQVYEGPEVPVEERTNPGKLIQPVDRRSRTVSTGARPPPGLTRAIVDRLRKIGAQSPAAGLADVIGGLEAADIAAAREHFSCLRTNVPSSRRLGALVSTLESLGDDVVSAPALSPRIARSSFAEVIESIVADAAVAGRCAACLSPAANDFRRCGTCGFEPS